tara:strand:- start:3684 stop:3812 length:129 start_codon:yes stop_codon:yes gene_type:complete
MGNRFIWGALTQGGVRMCGVVGVRIISPSPLFYKEAESPILN